MPRPKNTSLFNTLSDVPQELRARLQTYALLNCPQDDEMSEQVGRRVYAFSKNHWASFFEMTFNRKVRKGNGGTNIQAHLHKFVDVVAQYQRPTEGRTGVVTRIALDDDIESKLDQGLIREFIEQCLAQPIVRVLNGRPVEFPLAKALQCVDRGQISMIDLMRTVYLWPHSEIKQAVDHARKYCVNIKKDVLTALFDVVEYDGVKTFPQIVLRTQKNEELLQYLVNAPSEVMTPEVKTTFLYALFAKRSSPRALNTPELHEIYDCLREYRRTISAGPRKSKKDPVFYELCERETEIFQPAEDIVAASGIPYMRIHDGIKILPQNDHDWMKLESLHFALKKYFADVDFAVRFGEGSIHPITGEVMAKGDDPWSEAMQLTVDCDLPELSQREADFVNLDLQGFFQEFHVACTSAA